MERIQKSRFADQIAELAPVLICTFDLMEERVLFITRNVATFLGYTSDEIVQTKNIADRLAHPEDLLRYREVLENCARLEDGEVVEAEYRLRRRDGEWRWVSTRLMPCLRDEQGAVRQLVAATLDITARRQADENQRMSEKRIRSYFELGLIGMAITSPEKNCVEVNDEICNILGYEKRELVRKTWSELTHPDDLEKDIAQFQKVIAGECDGYSIDKRWIRKDGQIIDSMVSIKCVRRAVMSISSATK